MEKTSIRDFSGKILGWVEEDPRTGNKTVRDFSGRILARYDKSMNVTRDFSGVIISRGDTAVSALYNQK